MTNSLPQDTETVVGLGDVFALLQSRVWFILGLTVFFTVAATGYTFVLEPVYEARLIVELARIEKDSVQQRDEVLRRLNLANPDSPEASEGGQPTGSLSARPARDTDNSIEITTQGPTNAVAEERALEAFEAVKQAQNELIADYVAEYTHKIADCREIIASLEEERQEVETELADYRKKVAQVRSTDATQNLVHLLIKGKSRGLSRALMQQESKLSDLQKVISDTRLHRTRKIGEVELFNDPVKPKRVLVGMTAGAGGLLLSVILVLLWDAFVRGRRSRRARD